MLFLQIFGLSSNLCKADLRQQLLILVWRKVWTKQENIIYGSVSNTPKFWNLKYVQAYFTA